MAAAQSPIKGLYLSGSDVASVGVIGAMMGGGSLCGSRCTNQGTALPEKDALSRSQAQLAKARQTKKGNQSSRQINVCGQENHIDRSYHWHLSLLRSLDPVPFPLKTPSG